jgi:hypothetical protein
MRNFMMSSPRRRIWLNGAFSAALALSSHALIDESWFGLPFAVLALLCISVGAFASDGALGARWKWLQFGYPMFDDHQSK